MNMKSMIGAVRQARADVDDLRDKIAALRVDRREVATACCSRAEASERIKRSVATARDRAVLQDIVLPACRPESSSLIGADHFRYAFSNDPLAVLATVMPEALTKALIEAAPDGGIGAAEREARLAQIDADLEALEISEEIALREIEGASDSALPRRKDAPPSILLAPMHELNS